MGLAKGLSEERETFVPAGGATSVGHTRLRIGDAGRVVIPAEMRAAMGVKPGDVVTAAVVDGELRLLSRDAAIRKAQAMVREYVPAGVSLVDELISDRREEARQDTER